MSIMTSADFEGSIVMGVVVVCTVYLDLEEGVKGVDGCVKSKPVCEE